MSRLTETQLVILSAASWRDDRGVDLPTNVTAEAIRKAVDKLIHAGLLEEVRANDSLLAWRRDAEAGPMALRITKQGLDAIGVKEDATGAPPETSTCASPDEGEAETPVAKSSRKRTSAAARRLAGKKQQPGKAKTRAPLAARKPTGLETSSRANHAGPAGGSDDWRHHARNPLAAALGPRLLRCRSAQKARSRSSVRECRR
jgi:hypothetical protein